MSGLLIRDLPDRLRQKLKERAKHYSIPLITEDKHLLTEFPDLAYSLHGYSDPRTVAPKECLRHKLPTGQAENYLDPHFSIAFVD